MVVFVKTLPLLGISFQIFGFILYFLSDILIFLVLDGKSLQGYPINAIFRQCSITGPTIFLLYINDLPDDVIYDIAIFADDTTLYCECDQVSNSGNN